jgi:hypothetical protein
MGLMGATLLLSIVGLARAIAQYGEAGLIAYIKLLAGPSVVLIVAIYLSPGLFRNGNLGGLLPSDVNLKRASIAILSITIILLVASSILGVGWLVRR